MNTKNSEDILYHYTSVETLALILKNKTLRFNNLKDMDDLEEGNSTDFENIGRFIFSSSWTKDSKESIPLWNLYTPEMTGIRIGLPKFFFSSSFDEKNEIYKDIQKFCEERYSSNVTIISEQIKLIEMQYTDNPELICPEVFMEYKKGEEIDYRFQMEKIGVHKRTVWDFQKEWRYIVKVVPFSNEEFLKMREGENRGKDIISEALRSRNIFPYIDIPIEPKMLSKMRILCGPKMSVANKIIVDSLIEKFNPTITIENSNLKIR